MKKTIILSLFLSLSLIAKGQYVAQGTISAARMAFEVGESTSAKAKSRIIFCISEKIKS